MELTTSQLQPPHRRFTKRLLVVVTSAAVVLVLVSVTSLVVLTHHHKSVAAGAHVAGNVSSHSKTLSGASSSAADKAPPTTPSKLVATAMSPTAVGLAWTASTDNVGVTKYLIIRNGKLISTIAPATSFSDATAFANTSYSYQIKAQDAAGNNSAPSNTASVMTPKSASSATATNATAPAGVSAGSSAPVASGGQPNPVLPPSGSGGGNVACTAALSCWPNATNTGYTNAPGYPGTGGVADPTKLITASAGSSACPTTFQSHHTYSFCYFPGGFDIGSPQYPGDPDVGQHLTDVHFVGILVDGVGPTDSSPLIKMYCASNCTIDYMTMKPSGLNAPDVSAPMHGTTYAKSYAAVLGAGWGAYYTYARGYSLTHSDIWGNQSGIILGGANTAATPNLIQDNWLHDQGQCLEAAGCPTHADGIGMVDTGGTAAYTTINHNNMPFIQDNTNDIAFQQGTYDHLTITNNILSGDGYTVAIWATSTNTTFTGNVWTNYSQHLFGVNYGQDFWDTPGSVWAHNKFMWDSSGASPFYEQGPGSGNANPITAADSGKCWVPSGLSTTDYKGGGC